MIQENFVEAEAQSFIGIGSRAEQYCFSENQGCDWYWNRYGEDLSLFDELALCFLLDCSYKQQSSWYRSMLAKHPHSYRILYGLAITEHNAEHFQMAQQLFNRVIDLHAFDKPFEMLAFIHEHRELNYGAARQAVECLSRNPSNIFARYVEAVSLKGQNIRQKREKLTAILAMEPDYGRVLCDLSECFLAEANFTEARQCIQKCLFLDSQNFTYKIHYSELLLAEERYQEVTRLLSRGAVKGAPSAKLQRIGYYCLGCSFQQLGKQQQAIRMLEKYIKEKGSRPNAFVRLAELYDAINENDKLIFICRRFLEKSPKGSEDLVNVMQLKLIDAHFEEEDLEMVVQEAQRFLKDTVVKQQRTVLSYKLAQAYLSLGDLEQSLRLYRKCYEQSYEQKGVVVALFTIIEKIEETEDFWDREFALKVVGEFMKRLDLNRKEALRAQRLSMKLESRLSRIDEDEWEKSSLD